ncbi:MAG: hypothetical protein LBM96_01845 [Methanobrevibacter sp.]|jgi:hypothetical protein|nr:hypothetical protein [Candidatus Methanoflexus mossambicus]
MKSGSRNKNFIGEYIIYDSMTPRMWAIVIMPIELRVDNAHGFVHIHFSHRGIKHKINKNNFYEIYEIIVNHIEENKIIDKRKLWDELNGSY